MGLLSKIKDVAGKIKNKASSSLGALKSQTTRLPGALGKVGKVVGTVARVGVKGAKFVAKRSPLGTALVAGAAGITAIKAVANKVRKAPAAKQEAGMVAGVQKRGSVLGTIAKGAVAIAAGGGIAFGVEKLAEAVGVRGGAGFVGRRPKKRKARKSTRRRRTRSRRRVARSRRSRSRRSSGRRVSFTTRDGRRVSFTPRRGGRRRTRRRRGRFTAYERRKIQSQINRDYYD